MGPRGDAISQTDWCVGEIMDTLDKHGLTENTLVIFASDNGPVLNDGYYDDSVARVGDHRPAGPYRGGKYSKFEAGTRTPFITHWPARIQSAELTGVKPDDGAGQDSENILAALLGESCRGRQTLVEDAFGLSLRDGDWKYIEPSGGAAKSGTTQIELGNSKKPQLYRLDTDPGERNNLAEQFPEKLKHLQDKLEKIRNRAE
jgi:arylsulfatase A-like enzyme